MRPTVSRVLGETLASLATDLLPTIPSSFGQGQLGTQLMLLASVLEEFERAAARRFEENRAVRAIFAQAAGLDLEEDLAARLAAAASDEDGDLRVSVLDATNDELRALLIELHAAAEELADDRARALEATIWDELALSTERRRLSSAPF